MTDNSVVVHERRSEPWKVTIVDTGESTLTGGRLGRVRSYVGDEAFCFTYGDGVADINIAELVAFHQTQGKLATLSAVQPPGRYGTVSFQAVDPCSVKDFHEKPDGDGGWINGGFFVLEPGVFDLIDGDQTSWEGAPMNQLALDGQLSAYRHHGFWRAMDTLRDKQHLDGLWESSRAPWKIW